ncbi:MAG: flagellar regulator YcgR PilZN domain-containing protein [Gammaproteobacteria bacterium]
MGQFDESNLIREERRRAHILKAMAQSRSQLTLLVPGTAEPSLTTLLDVDQEEGTIILDEAVPLVSSSKLENAPRVSVHSKLNGIPIQFNTRYEKLDQDEDGIPCYVFDFPEELYYDQKRESFRLREGIHSIRVAFRVGENEFSGHISDLSTIGVKIRLKNPGDLKVGDISDAFSLKLNDQLTFTTAAKICHQLPQPGVFGVEFLSLNDAEKQEIQYWIMDMQRKRLRL